MRGVGPTYDFGHFRLDTADKLLFCEGRRVHLTLKALEILRVLIESAGHVVEKDELMSSCWPDSFVEEAKIAENICMIRRALGDVRHTPEYIETVHRRGYRFMAPVSMKVPALEPMTQRAQGWHTGAPQLLSTT
jgi:DNA-binding winged helix-turn-helix (wHTH) protein